MGQGWTGLPAEVCVVFTEWILILQIQLCLALRVQSSKHLDQNIL